MPVPVDQPPGTYRLEFLDARDRVLGSSNITVRAGGYPRQNITLTPGQTELKPAPGELETVRALRGTVTDQRRWAEPFTVPVPGCMTSRYGLQRLYNGKPSGNYHLGLDQRSPAGGPVRAIAAGRVQFARAFNIHGNTVGIDHGQGVTSIYLHLSRFNVKDGDEVKKGDVIGYVGSTGRSTAPHLHWQLQVNGVAVNPLQWMTVAPCGAAAKKKRR